MVRFSRRRMLKPRCNGIILIDGSETLDKNLVSLRCFEVEAGSGAAGIADRYEGLLQG